MNIFYWLLYYLKCAFNLLISSCIKKEIIAQKKTSGKIKINSHLSTVKLYGTYKQMGNQYGQLLKKELHTEILIYRDFFAKNNSYLIKKIRKEIYTDNFLDSCYLFYLQNKEFFPEFIIEYIKGISETSGISFRELICLNLFPEVVENHCILYSGEKNGKLISVRTLDFGLPTIKQIITIFNPDNQNTYAVLGPMMGVCCFTGISNNGIILGESYYDYKIGFDSRKGVPFYFLFHQILANANNLEEVETILQQTKRISNLHIMASDYQTNQSKLFLSSSDKLIVDQVMEPENRIYSVTPQIKNNFEKYKENFNSPEQIINEMLPLVKSGELHCMIYHNNSIYVSVTTNILQSYNNSFYQINLCDLFQ